MSITLLSALYVSVLLFSFPVRAARSAEFAVEFGTYLNNSLRFSKNVCPPCSSLTSKYACCLTIHEAAINGCKSCIIRFLSSEEKGLVDRRDHLGQTPLHYAVKNSDCVCLQLLLDAHADPNMRDYWGYAPLDYTSLGCVAHHGKEVLLTLLRYGADILTIYEPSSVLILLTISRLPISLGSIKKLFIQDMRRIKLPKILSVACILAKRQVNDRGYNHSMLRVKLVYSYQQALAKILWGLKIFLLHDCLPSYFLDEKVYEILKKFPKTKKQDAYTTHSLVVALINEWAQEASDDAIFCESDVF